MKRFSVILIISVILFATPACKREMSGARYDSNDEMQIMDYIDTRPDLSIFRN
ncbi:hypothetical protein LWM68_23035 [Niabella sp. W65]|nr:hypothetical protein [Niabella sp. W65]MCH7365390.1 hypothetical protein [Niabella sp. W65]ULT41181.1 hypothetical protein KRR40_41920 [Niabella sp. I65]